MSTQQQNPSLHQEEFSFFCDEDRVGYLSSITSHFWTAILERVPLGYQDEIGFHFGTTPPSNRNR